MNKKDLLHNNMLVLLAHQIQAYKCESGAINNITVYDDLENIYNIDNLLISEKLIFLFPEIGCTSCLENELLNFKEAFLNVPEEKIIMISKFDNKRSLKVFKNANNINCLTLSINEGTLNDCLEAIAQPCIFVSDSSLMIKCFFIPVRDNPQLSKRYYNIIKERFFDH